MLVSLLTSAIGHGWRCLCDATSRRRDSQLPLSSTMTRLSFVALLALAFSGVALAAPPAPQEIVAVGDVHTTGGWSYSICGTCVAVFRIQL